MTGESVAFLANSLTKRNSLAYPILSEVLEKDLLQGEEGPLERALCNV
jgi:hypothetical protein